MGRVRALWRGDVKLWKAFWIFGAAAQLVFSFVFFKLNLLSVFNKPKVLLPVDLALLAVFIAYGIFLLISVWKSGKKYEGLRAWRYLSRIAAILVVLWFGANMWMYVSTKTSFSPEFLEQINNVPRELTISDSNIQVKNFYFWGFTLKFPFYKSDLEKSFWSFPDPYHRLKELSILLNNKKGFISFDKMSSDASSFGFRQIFYDSKLADFSWWDIQKNVFLLSDLWLKSTLIGVYGSSAFNVQTPYLKGFLTCEHDIKRNNYFIEFEFAVNNETYSFSGRVPDKKTADKFMSMLGTIQPITNKDKAIAETKALLVHKDQSPYPEDLLLCSLMSLRGPDVQSMKELKRLAEEGHDTSDANSIDEEIKFLSGKEGK